jgi:Asp-tRNA(Asn)/Glu-tRNA(Gln) amidotransferase A subunit family amidase
MLSLKDCLGRIAAGVITPDEAVSQALEEITARDPDIGAFVCIDQIARAGKPGPLLGIAVGVKDIIDTAYFPTQMGSALYEGWRPRSDAWIVTKLRRLGATIIGKTTTTPFASSDPAATRNPLNPTHTPGGSSAGSAAAVAAGFVPLAIGTQTGGSIIRPAAYCGVAAIKPSFGLLPTIGVKCYSYSLDTLGLFGASVADVAHALALLADIPSADLSDTPKEYRVGVVMQEFAGQPEHAAFLALQNATDAFERAGSRVRQVELPPIFAEAWRSFSIVQAFEAHQAFAWEYNEHHEALPPRLRRKLDATRDTSRTEYDEALSVGQRARSEIEDIFKHVDVILTMSASGPAPHGLASTGETNFNRLWTLLGVPCVNVPIYPHPGELPVGVQVIAPFRADRLAVEAAITLEMHMVDLRRLRTSWSQQKNRISAPARGWIE